MTSTNTIAHTEDLKDDITSECSKSNALLIGKSIFDKLAEVTGFDAGISRSLVETRVYGDRNFHVEQETMPQRIVMALNIDGDSVHIAMSKTAGGTKCYAMTSEGFSGLLGLLIHNISKDQACELFDMAVRIETKQRNYI